MHPIKLGSRWITCVCLLCLILMWGIPLSLGQSGAEHSLEEYLPITVENANQVSLISTFNVGLDFLDQVIFSSLGDVLAVVGFEATTVDLWDIPEETRRCSILGHAARISIVIFSLDGLMMATGSDDGVVNVSQTDSC